jgi:DNA repair protein RecO (recombination protein O)
VVEALILRTWPVHEADQIVSFFTREQGKLKGIAKSAAKSRKRFGGALEPMTYVLASYAEKPRQELVRLDACEIVVSPLSEPVDYGRAAALEFFAEVLEETLQDRDPQDAVFRLTVAVLEQTRAERMWLPVTYFGLWMVRLMGWMPEIIRCTMCGRPFAGEPAYFESERDGLVCAEHRHPAARALSAESLGVAARIFREPIAVLAAEDWPRNRAADLRRFVLQGLERHLERRLRSVQALNQLAQRG